MDVQRLYKGTPRGFISCPFARNFDTSGSSVDINKERDT